MSEAPTTMVETPDTLPHVEERAVIATLELVTEYPALDTKLRLKAAKLARGEETFSVDLFAMEVRKDVETLVAELLGSPVAHAAYSGRIPSPIRRVVADWMVNISWTRVATALYVRYCEEGRRALPGRR
jgi:hypothetical protein